MASVLGISDLSGPMGPGDCTGQYTGHHKKKGLKDRCRDHFYLFVFVVFDIS